MRRSLALLLVNLKNLIYVSQKYFNARKLLGPFRNLFCPFLLLTVVFSNTENDNVVLSYSSSLSSTLVDIFLVFFAFLSWFKFSLPLFTKVYDTRCNLETNLIIVYVIRSNMNPTHTKANDVYQPLDTIQQYLEHFTNFRKQGNM